MNKKWAYRPGEKLQKKEQSKEIISDARMEEFRSIVKQHSELVENHLANTGSPRTAVMSDGHEVVYFVSLDEDYQRMGIDVAVHNGRYFVYLSSHLAEQLSDKYFEYIDIMSEIFQDIDGGELH